MATTEASVSNGTHKSDSKPGQSHEGVALRHYPQATKNFKPPEIANGNAFLGDVFSNDNIVPGESALSCGLYRLEPGPALEYTYTYHEMKIILEGDFIISDETGQKVHAKPGDIFNFPKGSKIRFETEKGGLAFYTGQRKEGSA